MRFVRPLAICALGAIAAPAAAQSNARAQVLWYDAPATQWVEALPVGNGRLGAMVFGGAAQERHPVQRVERVDGRAARLRARRRVALPVADPRAALRGRQKRGRGARTGALHERAAAAARVSGVRRPALRLPDGRLDGGIGRTDASWIWTARSRRRASAPAACASRGRCSRAIPIRSSWCASARTGRVASPSS